MDDDGGTGESEIRAKQWHEFASQSIPSKPLLISCLHRLTKVLLVQGRIVITRDDNGRPKFPHVAPGDDLAHQAHAYLSALYGTFVIHFESFT